MDFDNTILELFGLTPSCIFLAFYIFVFLLFYFYVILYVLKENFSV